MNQHEHIRMGGEAERLDEQSGNVFPFPRSTAEKESAHLQEGSVGTVSENVTILSKEFSLLDKEIDTIINDRAAPVSLAIHEALEEHETALGEVYGALFEAHEKIATTINETVHEDEALIDEVEQSRKLLSEQVERKRALKTRLEVSLEELFVLAKKVHESVAVVEKSPVKPVPEQKPVSSVEKRIGSEQYEALRVFVSEVWQGLRESIPNKTVLVADQNTAWQEQFLPVLKEEIENFLREHTDLPETEYKTVIDALITKGDLPRKRALSKPG